MQRNRSLLALAVVAALGLAGCNRDETATTPPTTESPTAAPDPGNVEPAAGGDTSNAQESTVPGTATPRPDNAGTMATSGTGAVAQLESGEGKGVSGRLLFTSEGTGVRVTGTITGLSASAEHGFHVHENGACDQPAFESAGPHFNPAGAPHGNPTAGGPHHAGDIPNLTSDAQGNANVDALIPAATLGDGAATDILGRAILVHEKRDDYATQPSGDSGARIACGKISAG